MTARGAQHPDLTPQQRERWERDRRWRLRLLIGGVVSLVVALVVGALLGHSRRPDQPVPWVPLIVTGAGVLVLTAGVAALAMRRRDRSTTLNRLVVSGDRATIQRVSRGLKRGEPVADADLEVAQALVAQSRTQRWVPRLFGVAAVLNLASAALPLLDGKPSVVLLVLRALAGVGLLTAAVLVAVGRRRLLRGAERARLPAG